MSAATVKRFPAAPVPVPPRENATITVKTAGGELKVRYENGSITLFGGAQEVFSGTFRY